MPDKKTFFISRAGPDKRWAELIASVVRDAGHEPFFEDENFRVGQDIIDNMMRGAKADCTIAVFSPDYFKSDYCRKELDVVLFEDPLGRKGKLIPILVAPVKVPDFVADIAYLNLVGADEDTARQRVLATLQEHGQIDRSALTLTGQTRRVVDQADRDRAAMIQKVRAIWIQGVLRDSLSENVRIVLGLRERPDAVDRPFGLFVMRPDQRERPLPTGTQVVDVYDASDRSLLILGEPGSGKTTELLTLAKNLLDRADRDSIHPIPVVLPLTTWAEARRPLAEWLQDELHRQYEVPKTIAREWVATKQVLPLLDGLDEVKTHVRNACVEAINLFRHEDGFLPMVVTCRTADYEALARRLHLQTALVIPALSRKHVESFLVGLGRAGKRVRSALREDPRLWELLDTPLMLNIVMIIYEDKTVVPSLMGSSLDAKRDFLFDSYFSRMLSRNAVGNRYSLERTRHWLSWLASEMDEHAQKILHLERMQFEWLPANQRQQVQSCARATTGLVTGLVAGPLVGLGAALAIGNLVGKLNGLVCWGVISAVHGPLAGLYGGLGINNAIACADKVHWSRLKLTQSLRASWRPYIWLVGWFVGGVAFGAVLGGTVGYASSVGRRNARRSGWYVRRNVDHWAR